MTPENSLSTDLKFAKALVYDKCGFAMTNLKLNSEGEAYGACTFQLNANKIEYRVSKITPTKTGQFVAIWKRNMAGITAPFHVLDDIDFFIITSKNCDNFGQFIFPKSVLAAKGIISTKDKGGKRGIRVYPPWDIVTNKQAERSQKWQTQYFLTIKDDKSIDLSLIKRLLIKPSALS